MGANDLDLAHTLADAFNTLADEVQTLADRRTVLEHKLRFAHEQFQYLADKYAPAAPEIAETLANLQLPPHTPVDENTSVPLPQRNTPASQHQLALVIRDGRRMASQLASLRETSKTTDSSRVTFSQTSKSHQTSMSTQLEHDYTVEGKKGDLQCPFTKISSSSADEQDMPQPDGSQNHGSPHPPSDPICAAMFEETASQAGTNATASIKCPIRFMDKHSPEEIANYVEAHKHELPRSHEVCLRRYQKNEHQIRKLDSKYGNVVSMIECLSQLHQPMLPEDADDAQLRGGADGASNERVETWAQAISVTTDPDAEQRQQEAPDPERDGHFDRPLKEVRVGESPSRPWGISVPVPDTYSGHDFPMSPPPAPVHMPRLSPPEVGTSKPTGKCPFDHTKLSAMAGLTSDTKLGDVSPGPQMSYGGPPPVTPLKQAPQLHGSAPSPSPQPQHTQVPPQPAFIDPTMGQPTAGQAPQMVFTGPVFIGYPIEQAIQFMNQYRGPQ